MCTSATDGYLMLYAHACPPQVPMMNNVTATELKPWSLVRFQGMVQDICDKEIYPARFVALNKQTGEKVREYIYVGRRRYI